MDINKTLKTEIDLLINKTNFNELLNSYGELFVVGSYVYDLMAWRDFDLVLKVNELNDEIVNSIIDTIKSKINPDDIKFFDNRNNLKNNRPHGYWLGIFIRKWKIDLWIMDSSNANIEKQKNLELNTMLENVDKNELIKLKVELSKDSGYHSVFSSVDLYNSYVKDNIRNAEDFYDWLKIKYESP